MKKALLFLSLGIILASQTVPSFAHKLDEYVSRKGQVTILSGAQMALALMLFSAARKGRNFSRAKVALAVLLAGHGAYQLVQNNHEVRALVQNGRTKTENMYSTLVRK